MIENDAGRVCRTGIKRGAVHRNGENMIKSMTGFGRSEVITEEYKMTVEMKAVNHRYCDIGIKLPKKFNCAIAIVKIPFNIIIIPDDATFSFLVILNVTDEYPTMQTIGNNTKVIFSIGFKLDIFLKIGHQFGILIFCARLLVIMF